MDEEPLNLRPDLTRSRNRLRGLSAVGLLNEGLRTKLRPSTGSETWIVPRVEDLRPLLPEYEILRSLGQGGMGSVYEARHRTLNRKVALKVLPIELGELEGMAARFRSEAETLARVQHPGIVAIYDFGSTEPGHLYYSMEFVEGEDLASRLERSPIRLQDAVRIVEVLAAALGALHRHGIVHRDIKPGNILLEPDGQPRLVDFGLASSLERELASPRLTRRGKALGTLEYAAPEQLKGLPTGPAADLYSLGVVTYELLTGDLPRGVFEPPSIRNRDLDPAFDGPVMAALQSDPARRPKSTNEFGKLLAEAFARRQNRSIHEKQLRTRAHRNLLLAGLLGLAAVGAAGLAWFGLQARHTALVQSERADRFREGAESLITFMIDDLESQLEDFGRLDILDESLQRTEHYFESTRDEDSENDPAGLSRHAAFYRNRAAIHRFRGNHQAALADLQRALPLRERAVKMGSGNPVYQLELGRCLTRLAESSSSAALNEEALAWSGRALETLAGPDALPHRDTARLLAWVQAARLHGRQLARARRPAEARAQLEGALAISRQRAANGEASKPRWEFERAAVEQELGVLEEREGNQEAATSRFAGALAGFRGVHQKREWALSSARASCEVSAQLSALLLLLGKPMDAADTLAQAVRLIDEMDDRSPEAAYVLEHQRQVYPLLAETYRRLDRPVEAQDWEQRAARIKEK